jgi:hypothetical protein
MFEQITELISALANNGALRDHEVVDALAGFAKSISDTDYRSRMLGELAVKLAETRLYDDAEKIVRQVENCEKSEFIRVVAENEAHSNHLARALQLFQEAREAVSLHRFPTQRGQALAEIATSLSALGLESEALKSWELAIHEAKQGQVAGGTDGPEAAGVLLVAVRALASAGNRLRARSVAETISFPAIRDEAMKVADDRSMD